MSDAVSSTPAPTPAAAPSTKSASSAPASTNTPSNASNAAPTGTTPPTPAERAEQARLKFKLKVDGAEKEVEYAHDEVAVRLQKGEAAERRMQEAAELRKQFAAFQEGIKKDPFSALKDQFGVDAMELAKQRLIEEYEQRQLQQTDPKQAEVVKLQRELEQLKAQQDAWNKEREARAQAEHEAKLQAQIEADFMTALEASDLPKTKQTLALMAQVALEAHRAGWEPSPQQLVSEVHERLRGYSGHVFKGLKGEQLAKFLGPEVVREILQHSITKVKPDALTPPAPVTPAVDDEPEPVQARQTKRLRSWKEFMRGD